MIDRDSWQTPQELFEQLNNQYNFNLDCCATKKNTKISNYCKDFFKYSYSPYITAWMNPPFSKAHSMFEHFFNVINKGVTIYRCDNMETKVWQDIIFKYATWVFIPNKRIVYEGFEGKGSRFPSALIGYNVPEPKGLDGTIIGVK